MKLKFASILIFVVFVIVAFSCRKSKETSLLHGTWEIIPIAGSDSIGGPPQWTFHPDNMLTRYRFFEETNTELFDTGYYFFYQEFNNFTIGIHDLDGYVDGIYSVKGLDKRVMILEQTSPYIHKEFKRL